MVNILVRFLILTLAVCLVSYVLPGVHIANTSAAFLVAFFLSFLNVFVRPIFIILTLPLTIFSLGLFLLIINGVLVLLADHFLENFYVDSLGWAILFSILISFSSYILGRLLRNNKKKE